MPPSWIERYDQGVPASLAPYPSKTLLDYLRESAARRPDAPAVMFKGISISNAGLVSLSEQFAASLAAEGVRRGDRVALLLPNCPQFVIAEFGAWTAGATVLPLNPLYTADELVEPLRDAGVEIIVTLTPFYKRVKEVQAKTAIRHVIATNIKEYLPPVLRALFTLFKENKGGHRITLEPGDSWFQDHLKVGRVLNSKTRPTSPDPPYELTPPRPEDPAIMLMSGGTTGTPKAVVGLHRSLACAGEQLTTWLKGPDGSPDEISLCPLPLFHVYGCVGVQSHCFVSGATLALVPNPRDIMDLLKSIQQVRPTMFCAVPSLFIALLNHPKVKDKSIDFSSIRACFSGAAPLMASTKTEFEALTGGRIVEGYSLTEGMMACIVNPLNGVNKVGSIGIPLPDVEVAIVDSETGNRFLPAGETGEIILRAPQLMAGYFNNPEETASALRTHDSAPSSTGLNAGPWLHTGDLGYLDQDSYVFIVDRQKDLIKTSGYQVWPREVEEVLSMHPGVQEVGVAGVPDDLKGEAVKAWVVKRAGMSPSIDELRSHCRQKLAPYKTPSFVEFRESLPKTMTGKVLRRALVAEHKAATSN